MAIKEITIPHNFIPRPYQLPFLQVMEKGDIKRAALVWHRRCGKGKTLINFTAARMCERVGAYYHVFPEYSQGKKIMWDGRDKDGFKFTDHFPKEIVTKRNETELKITLRNGSIWQIIGADNYDSLVGPNPVGIVFDEWAVSDKYPHAWDYFRPILAENGGWAVFIYTPRGRNHGFDLYQNALNNPDWFCQMLTVRDTGAVNTEAIEAERRAGMSDDMIQQEFYCSFLASTADILIPFELIQAALDREIRYDKAPKIAGLDVARFGDDRTALIVRQAGVISYVETWGRADVVETAGRVMDRYKTKLFDTVAVDTIGIGAGVADILRSNGVPVAMVQVSEKASDEERFDSQRDELWYSLREWFEEGACSIPKSLYASLRQAILKDIQDIRFKYSPTGKIKVEKKDEMKKRIGHSPDIGDALCLTFTKKITLQAPEYSKGKEVRFKNWEARKPKSRWDGRYQEVRVG
jgi:hypothetical protein